MYDKMVSDDPFKLQYCRDRYRSLEICNKTFDDFLPVLKFVPDWLLKII